MTFTFTPSRRHLGAAVLVLAGLSLAGCEERLSDEIVVPRGKPERQRIVASPTPVVARHAAPWSYDPYRSNCALARC